MRLCPHCNKELTKNKEYDSTSLEDERVGIENYKYECNFCDENFFEFEAIKRYEVIQADPPWRQSKGGRKSVRPNSSGKELEYPVISIEEIESILAEASDLGTENHVLFLWTIEKYLPQAEKIANELGYKLHARMIWNKVTGIPSAFTIRYGHEYLLYLYKEKLLKIAKDERGKIHSVFTEQVKRHSQKPQIAYEIIERLYPSIDRLELFARNKREGWDVWGNEVECDVELLKEPQTEVEE